MLFYDRHHVRYQLSSHNDGDLNWLFFPGGPGADSAYLTGLINGLSLPGKVWRMDLPGNGSNRCDATYNFDQWIQIFPETVQHFQNLILVGHSFGGMFPLLFPELENSLKGFVILNSAPCLWLEEAVAYSKKFDLPDLTREMQEFTARPSQESFEIALDACMPYYFPPDTLEIGRKLLSQVPFSYLPAVWWQRKAIALNFTAKWVPQNVSTLILSGAYDCICPFTLFQKDRRFQRPNIDFFHMEDAGHMPWVDNFDAVKRCFGRYVQSLGRQG